VVDFGSDGAYVGVDIGLAEEDDIEGFLGPVDGRGVCFTWPSRSLISIRLTLSPIE